MTFAIADRVQETTTTTGTGSVTLLGAVTGYQSFAVIGNTNTTYYCIADQGGANWEVGIGQYSTTGPTLARTTVLSSSNAGSLVNFTAGTKTVFVTYPSEVSVYASNTPTASYVLTAQGVGVPPIWAAASGGGAASYTRTTQTATAAQTTFSVTYTAPYIQVFLNGVLLENADYTATSGTTVVLGVAAGAGDILTFIAFSTTSIAVAGGSNTQVQYNSSGSLAGNAGFTFNGTDLNIPFGTSGSATSTAKIALAMAMIA
jgi:hypothetical protein